VDPGGLANKQEPAEGVGPHGKALFRNSSCYQWKNYSRRGERPRGRVLGSFPGHPRLPGAEQGRLDFAEGSDKTQSTRVQVINKGLRRPGRPRFGEPFSKFRQMPGGRAFTPCRGPAEVLQQLAPLGGLAPIQGSFRGRIETRYYSGRRPACAGDPVIAQAMRASSRMPLNQSRLAGEVRPPGCALGRMAMHKRDLILAPACDPGTLATPTERSCRRKPKCIKLPRLPVDSVPGLSHRSARQVGCGISHSLMAHVTVGRPLGACPKCAIVITRCCHAP